MFDTRRGAATPDHAMVQTSRKLGELVRYYILLSPYMSKDDLG